MGNAIILCSGGLDSVTTAHYVKKNLEYEKIRILFFNYGQKSLEKEREFSKKCAEDVGAEFKEIELKWLGEISNSLINQKGEVNEISERDLKDTTEESKNWYVPCRNLIFLSSALSFAESINMKEKLESDIFVGFKYDAEGGYPDTTPEFVAQVNELSKIDCEGNFEIIAPLIKKDKEEIVKLGRELKVDFNKTHSCYTSAEKHCGKCLACQLRRAGFKWAGVEDRTEYID